VQLNGELTVELRPEFNFGPRGQVDRPSPEPGVPIPEPETENKTRVIVGAIVTATQVSTNTKTQIFQDGNPDIFAPRIANVSFYITTSDGNAWTSDIPVKNVRQYVPCPSVFGAVEVAATAEEGFSVDVNPVWDYPAVS
jgi:hypothetical protein